MKNTRINEIIKTSEKLLEEKFERIDSIALANQEKVLNALASENTALRHFVPTSGYGYDDVAKEQLCKVFAKVFDAESALVSPAITCGTQALALALFGVLRPNDLILSVTGDVYDSFQGVISGSNGSLEDFGVSFDKIELVDDDFNYQAIDNYLKNTKVKMIYVQKSKGYSHRNAVSVDKIKKLCDLVAKRAIVFVDNCYGEFVEDKEPTSVGANLMAGSLIKNAGGGICPTGGYVAGDKALVDMVWGRLTAPTLGNEVGSYAFGYREFFQGLFLAPHVVAQALKTASLFSQVFHNLGYDVFPTPDQTQYDIPCSIDLHSEEKLIKFCQAIQKASPIDAFALPTPWEMPGYNDKVIMAAGCFVQGSSIELSCDGPLKEPYTVYFQGGLTYEHGKIALKKVLQDILDD